MRELWNEGRVVGYSAYEMYIRQVSAADPTAIPATEKQWLSSTIAYGSSMLVWVASDDISGPHYRDIQFPDNCRLCAANTILASMFIGEGGEVDENGWATKILSFGNLIGNTSTTAPNAGVADEEAVIPVLNSGSIDPSVHPQFQDYIKITDGIVIQPGTWVLNDDAPPQMNLLPKLSKHPRLRISFSDTVVNGFWLLLTGFTNGTIIMGVTGIDDVVGDTSLNGEFLGPATFPWAAKVVFSIPPILMNSVVNSGYNRKLPSTGSDISVRSSAIIDMASAAPQSYYTTHYASSAIEIVVSELSISSSSASILVTYQTDSDLPPALYGSSLASGTTGSAYIGPIDIVAPGTIKVYQANGQTMAETLEDNTSENIGMYRTEELVIYQINQDAGSTSPNRYVPLSEDKTIDLAALMLYNTKYLWFYSLNAGANPTQQDLQNVFGINGIQVLSGFVSDMFIDTFCVSYATAVAACADGHISDALHMQRSYIDQIVAKYGAQSAADDFVYFFANGYTYISGAGQQGMFYPINVNTHKIEATIDGGGNLNADHGINFSNSSIVYEGVTVPNTTSDIMGGFWNLGDASSTSVSQPTSDSSGDVFTNHPVLSKVITQYETFSKPYTGVPKPPAKYNNNFVGWFSNTMVTDILATETLNMMGIHSDYRSLDMQSFLQYAATRRDMTEPMSTIPTDATTEFVLYIYSKSGIESVADVSWTWTTQKVKSSIKLTALKSQYDFYKPVNVTLDSITVSDEGEATIVSDITDVCTDPGFHQWASHGQSGEHTTTSLSLVDQFGGLLPFSGSAGSISANYLNWEALIDALSQNKNIDLLGNVLRGMKSNLTGSGTNYLEFSNGLRFYVASSAPSDASIPANSVGIGWGSGIHIYNGGWS